MTARRRALDARRKAEREARAIASQPEAETMGDVITFPEPIPDERLRLLFICCHPALAVEARIALALRTICGVSVPRIARAFLVAEPTMYQRITRAKAKIGAAKIPFETPPPGEWAGRVGAVLETLETALGIAYRNASGAGDTAGLAPEVERLAELLAELMPAEAEAFGLLAMVSLIRSRENPGEIEGNAHLLMMSLGAAFRRRTKIGTYGADLLYKLGMLGTMVGFVMMLNSMGDLSNFDVDTLRGALQKMIAGMAVSLLTTIAGLIGGILLRLEYNIADALVTDISQTAVSFTEVSLLPLLAHRERENGDAV